MRTIGLFGHLPYVVIFSTDDRIALWSEAFWVAFLTSPAAAGLGAVLAALLAVTAARMTVRSNQRIATEAQMVGKQQNAEDQWWKRAEWALNLVVNGRPRDHNLAAAVLEAISDDTEGKSELNVALGAYLQDRMVDISDTEEQEVHPNYLGFQGSFPHTEDEDVKGDPR